MIELKREINALLEELGKAPRYKVIDELYDGGGGVSE